MRRIGQGLSAGLLAIVAGAAQAQTLQGEWCGVAVQTGPREQHSEWSATLQLEGATGRMDYPSLGCGGVLSFERREGETHYYRERIDIGRTVCYDNGLIGVQLREGAAHWVWTGSGATATALLTPTCRMQPGVRSEPQPKGGD